MVMLKKALSLRKNKPQSLPPAYTYMCILAEWHSLAYLKGVENDDFRVKMAFSRGVNRDTEGVGGL